MQRHGIEKRLSESVEARSRSAISAHITMMVAIEMVVTMIVIVVMVMAMC